MSNTVEGRNGLSLTIDNVPSNQNPRCTLFRLSYQPMRMAALGTRLSLATTCNLLALATFLYMAMLAPPGAGPMQEPAVERHAPHAPHAGGAGGEGDDIGTIGGLGGLGGPGGRGGRGGLGGLGSRGSRPVAAVSAVSAGLGDLGRPW